MNARQNAAAIRKILVDQAGSAVLYRTITAGPSGQRAQLPVGRVTYTDQYGMELRVSLVDGPFRGETAGWARRSFMEESRTTVPGWRGRPKTTIHGRQMWALYEDMENEGLRFIGYADALSLGCDVLVNGQHAATGRHDSHRISPGRFVAYKSRITADL